MRKWGRYIGFALLSAFAAVAAPFAYAFDVCVRKVERFVDQYQGFGKAESQFKAELAANYGGRTSEAGRANGMVKHSNGFRMANMFKASGLPTEVGWRVATL